MNATKINIHYGILEESQVPIAEIAVQNLRKALIALRCYYNVSALKYGWGEFEVEKSIENFSLF